MRPLNARIAAQLSRNGSRSPFGASRFLTRPGDGRLVGFVGQDVDYTVKQADEILDLIALFALNRLQFVARSLVDGAHAPNEHVGEIVAGAHRSSISRAIRPSAAPASRGRSPRVARRAPFASPLAMRGGNLHSTFQLNPKHRMPAAITVTPERNLPEPTVPSTFTDDPRESGHFPGLSRISALLADPGRAAMLWALMDGSARPAGELTLIAGLSPSAASGHLARLTEGGLLALEVRGRHRYYRIATPEVAATVEALANLAQASAPQRTSVRAARTVPLDLRYARTCYDHMAGELAVRVFDGLLAKAWLVEREGIVDTTDTGDEALRR